MEVGCEMIRERVWCLLMYAELRRLSVEQS